ncbi:MAG: hypothetical protein RLZ00_1115, partial [Pseudomonadota bacterium]
FRQLLFSMRALTWLSLRAWLRVSQQFLQRALRLTL